MFHDIIAAITAFVQAHHAWAPFIVAALAFCELLAIVSFFVPATVILLGIGGLIGAAGLAFWPIWAAAVVGAVLGDWLSYWVGLQFGDRVLHSGPLARHAETTERASNFLRKWGAWGIFIGRFSGPLRAFVPLLAGIIGIRQLYFQAANIGSALIWAMAILSPGNLLGRFFG